MGRSTTLSLEPRRLGARACRCARRAARAVESHRRRSARAGASTAIAARSASACTEDTRAAGWELREKRRAWTRSTGGTGSSRSAAHRAGLRRLECLLERLKAACGGDRAQAEPRDAPLHRGPASPRRPRPRAPVDAQRGQPARAAVMRERVEESVGGRVVACPGEPSRDAADENRTKKSSGTSRVSACRLPCAVELRREHGLEARPALLEQHAVVEHAGRVDRRRAAATGGSAMVSSAAPTSPGGADVAPAPITSAPCAPSPRSRRARAPRGRRGPSGREARAMSHEPAGDFQPEPSEAAGDRVGGVRPDERSWRRLRLPAWSPRGP